MHEATHNGFGSNAKSMGVGIAAGAVLLVSYPVYRETHLSHHADPGGPKDRELPVVLGNRVDYLFHLTPWYFLIPFWSETVAHALDHNASGRVTRWLIGPIVAGLITATAIWPLKMVGAYWLPLFMTGFFLFVTTAHEHYSSRSKDWQTRNLKCGPILQWFLWNTNLHAQHHDKPDVPSALLRPDRNEANDVGLLEFHRSVWRDLAP
jgi:fatty acid desaturase